MIHIVHIQMPQLHLYVPKKVAALVRHRAHSRGQTVSRYLAEIVRRETAAGWPEGFFDHVVGGWRGARLRRPPAKRPERRDSL